MPTRTRSRTGADVERLVRAHQSALRSYLLYLGCEPSQVDDQVQETFLAFLRSTFEEQHPGATRTYLRTTARQIFLRSLEREGRGPRRAHVEHLDRIWAEEVEVDEGRAWQEALRRCLESLPQKARRVLEMRYAKSLSRVAISEQLGLQESGVKSILVRARRQLRDCVQRRMGA